MLLGFFFSKNWTITLYTKGKTNEIENITPYERIFFFSQLKKLQKLFMFGNIKVREQYAY